MFWDNAQNRLYHKNHHAPHNDSANPALMSHIQIFAGFCHAIFMSLQVHFTHCYIPSASHTTWSMMLFRAGCFISLGIFFLKENSHREVCIHANGFYMFTQLVYTLSFHVTCFYIAFLYQLPLGSVQHDAVFNNFAKIHTDNTQTLPVHCSSIALLLPPSCQRQGHLSIVMTNVYLYLFIIYMFLPLG